MFKQLIELYTHGDLDKIRGNILHSTAWRQHDFTSYGNSQIEKQWLKSIEQFGFNQLESSLTVSGDNYSALCFELSNKNNEGHINISLFFEHNESHIKRVNCIVDTISLAQLMNVNNEELINILPIPDPLLVSQFDHQLHPQSNHAKPKDLVSLPSEMAAAVDRWWNIWQASQLAGFDTLYEKSAHVNIAGSGAKNSYEQLRNFRIKLSNALGRSYCQLENICFDPTEKTVAVSWQIDGDYLDNGIMKRIRIPVMSFLTIEDGKISGEKFQVDWLSLSKRFQLQTPLL